MDARSHANDWAVTQNNLGSALMLLGERESGQAPRTGDRCFRDALKENSRELMPLDWAMIQNNLCIALRTLGSARAELPGWKRPSPPVARR